MGHGVQLICTNCHEEEPLFLGCGFNSFMNGVKNVVYICKRCGYWKTAEITLDKTDDKLDINLNELSVSKKSVIKQICPNCKIRMKKYEDITKFDNNLKPIIPKMTCNKCGGFLTAGELIRWD